MQHETLIDLLRHGQPVGGRRYRGKQDDPLSERGWEQMWHSASGETPWQQVISSPLSRCREFSEALTEKLNIPLTVDKRLQELDYGEWEGKTPDELKADDPEIISRYFHDPHNHRPPGAEYVVDFIERVGTAYDDVLAKHSGKHMLIVAHAGVIRAIITRALNAPPEAVFRMHVDTAHLSRIRVDGERPPTLMFHGRSKL
ncbi:MAG: alpha-ribazole phosphatase family protein [Candidatus Sedimenticola sp. 20ELBAFRAG]